MKNCQKNKPTSFPRFQVLPQNTKLAQCRAGFTLLEITVSIALFTLAIMLVGSMYDLSQKSYNKGSSRSELVQNARVSLDRMSREIRQAVNIATALPETDADPLNPPPQEIFFQDGHNIDQITYLKYYLSGADLMRNHIAYYFAEEPANYVLWNSVDQNGNPPTKIILEDKIIGEYFDDINFWGSGGLINTEIKLKKNQDVININSNVYMRN